VDVIGVGRDLRPARCEHPGGDADRAAASRLAGILASRPAPLGCGVGNYIADAGDHRFFA